MNERQRILQAFEQSQQVGTRAVLATVMQTSGSVYRRAGARMLLTEDGKTVGAISGGCLEADLLERSRSLLATQGQSTVIRYDTTASDDIVFGLGLGCNGTVDVLLESLDGDAARQQLDLIREGLTTQQTIAIATVFAVDNVADIRIGDRLMMTAHKVVFNQITHPSLATKLIADTRKVLAEAQTSVQRYTLPSGHIDVLLEGILPPLPLLLFGAGYDASPVVQFAKQLGWHVTVIDQRSDYLTRDRFPLADQVLCCQPEQAEVYLPLLTPQAVAVVMTHRYLSDLTLLKTLIPSQLRYLGVLGPKRRMQQLWQDLAGHGILPTPEHQQRLYNPVGLDIGAETPEEIALAIVAEIQAAIQERSGCCLRDRPGSIHASAQSPCLELAS